MGTEKLVEKEMRATRGGGEQKRLRKKNDFSPSGAFNGGDAAKLASTIEGNCGDENV